MTAIDRHKVLDCLNDLAMEIRQLPEGDELAAIRLKFFALIAELERQNVIPTGMWHLSSLA